MPTKVNIVLDDDVKAELDRLVKKGMRSRIINDALRRELKTIRQQAAGKRLDRLRIKTKSVSTAEIVRLIREVRGR